MHPNRENQFKQWVNDYSDLLYQYSVAHCPDAECARDMVQETFLAAWRNIDNYKGEASVKNWLFVILKSKITDYFRKSSNRMVLQTIEAEYADHRFFDADHHWADGAGPQAWKVDFDNRAETREFYNIFTACGKKLKEIQNNVFIMKYVDGLESEMICQELGISTSNYWVLIHRAKVQLRACLEKNWVGK